MCVSENMLTLQTRLQEQFPGQNSVQIGAQQKMVVEQWAGLQARATDRRDLLNKACDLHKFLSQARDLINWSSGLRSAMTAQEKVTLLRFLFCFSQLSTKITSCTGLVLLGTRIPGKMTCQIVMGLKIWQTSTALICSCTYHFNFCEFQVRDAGSAQTLKAEHEAIKAEIEAREDSFEKAVALCKQMVQEGHYASDVSAVFCVVFVLFRCWLDVILF